MDTNFSVFSRLLRPLLKIVTTKTVPAVLIGQALIIGSADSDGYLVKHLVFVKPHWYPVHFCHYHLCFL